MCIQCYFFPNILRQKKDRNQVSFVRKADKDGISSEFKAKRGVWKSGLPGWNTSCSGQLWLRRVTASNCLSSIDTIGLNKERKTCSGIKYHKCRLMEIRHAVAISLSTFKYILISSLCKAYTETSRFGAKANIVHCNIIWKILFAVIPCIKCCPV